jgi:hypothetical protein
MTKHLRKTPSTNLPRMLALIARQYRKACLDDDDAKELFYIFCANDLGWEPPQDINQFIADNHSLLEPLVDDAMRTFKIGGVQ